MTAIQPAPLPEIPAGRQLIQSYGDGRFRISDKVHSGSVLVFVERVVAWPVTDASALTIDDLEAVLAAEPAVELLFVGCGPVFIDEPPGLRRRLRERGIALEWMTTGAACGTFNILIAEDRRMAAALVAVE